MVSVDPHPIGAREFHSDPSDMSLPGLYPQPVAGVSASTVFAAEDPSKKIRKPYTITKSRESWTEQEHDKFIEALHLFDRDWKKIEAFVGSKTVIQIRSHAQKYFLKVQKSGSNERVPPPRPKRKAAHPYPQKASKNGSRAVGSYEIASTDCEPSYCPGSSTKLNDQAASALMPSSWINSDSRPPKVKKDAVASTVATMVSTCAGCCSSSESTYSTLPASGASSQGDLMKQTRIMPDFAQVYRFIGSVFDPDARDHMQSLKKMDPINIETALLLMRNLSLNLMSPEFEDQRELFSSYDVESEKVRSCGRVMASANNNAKPAIAAI